MGGYRAATLDDVARATGTSPKLVTLSLIGESPADATLHASVADVAYEMGYVPLAVPQERLGRPLRLGIVMKVFRGDDPDANRFYAPIASAVTVACELSGARVEHAIARVDAHYRVADLPEVLQSGRGDGAFLLGAYVGASVADGVGCGCCPLVLVDGYSDADRLDSVTIDNASGARAVVERLYRAGHRDIALLGSEPDSYPSVTERRQGYEAAVRDLGLKAHFVDISYVLTKACAVMGMDYVRRHPEVTAVIGASDLVAVAFMQQARDSGIRIPADLSVAGFDDIDLANLVMPSLTTVGLERNQLARAAFTLMAYRLEHPEGEPIHVKVTPHLVDRESVAAPKPR